MKLQIFLLCYNHQDFIERNIYSLLNQRTNFNYEILVHDDASNDLSVKVINKIISQYPENIKLIRSFKNIGIARALLKLYDYSKADYLVLMDGDDYWTNTNKLQTQIDFLDANPEYVASCHDVKIESHININESNSLAKKQSKSFHKYISQFTTYYGDTIEAYQLLEGKTYIQNCSLVWRRFDLIPYLNTLSKANFNLDWYFSVVLASKGKIQYINEPWSVYVDHKGGETKKVYFHSYLKDKIYLLKSLLKNDFYKPLYFRYKLYDLISKNYYGLVVMETTSKKTTVFILKNTFYSVWNTFLKSFWFCIYVLVYFKQLKQQK